MLIIDIFLNIEKYKEIDTLTQNPLPRDKPWLTFRYFSFTFSYTYAAYLKWYNICIFKWQC